MKRDAPDAAKASALKVVSAADVPAPVLRFEELPCEPLGGMVRVRPMLLTKRLAIRSRVATLRAKNPDNPDEAAYAVIPEVLALAVVDAKDQPIYSVHRWEVFGSEHEALALELFNAAWELSGMNGEAAKKN